MVLSHSNLQTLFTNANCHMNALYTWLCANTLSLNACETKYIAISPKQRKCKFDNLKLDIKGMPLQRIGEDCHEQSTKFLGIYLDAFLNWKADISHLNRKLSRALFAIKQNKNSSWYTKNSLLYLVIPILNMEFLPGDWGGSNSSILRQTKTSNGIYSQFLI